MNDQDQDTPLSAEIDPKATDPPSLSDELFERYADEIKETEFTEVEQRELLLMIYQIMQSVVDLGFSIAPGKTFSGDDRSAKDDLGFDDVLDFLLTEDARHQDVRIYQKTKNKSEE